MIGYSYATVTTSKSSHNHMVKDLISYSTIIVKIIL